MNDSNPQPFFDTTSPERYQASRRVAAVAMATNGVLVIGQIIVGLIGHSQALVADAFHTLADMSTDVLVLFALKESAKEADAEHPYGHARIETAVTLVLGVILLIVGIGIAARAGFRLFGDEPFEPPTVLTLWVSGFTILAKEALYHYTMRVSRRFDSDMLRASAWHHRSDAISSVIVFLGIAGTIAGIESLDALAAVGVALFVMKIGVQLGWPAISELIDTGLDAEELKHIRRIILAVNGVRELHMLRTRRIGGRALVDVHIIVDDHISVSEGHYISEAVRQALLKATDVVADVLVHIDTEDDLAAPQTDSLPSRTEIQAELRERFRSIDAAARIEQTTLHYGHGKVRVELTLPVTVLARIDQAELLARQLREAVSDLDYLAGLDVKFR